MLVHVFDSTNHMGTGMLSYADGIDKLLLFFGTIGCIGEGMMIPATMLVLSDMISSYAQADSNGSTHSLNDAQNMVYIIILW